MFDEDHAFSRRGLLGLVRAGNRRLRGGDVAVLDETVIHAVTSVGPAITEALRVYGGDLFAQPRNRWGPVTLQPQPDDVAAFPGGMPLWASSLP